MASHKLTRADQIVQADQIIAYYQKLLDSGPEFYLGFYMAKQWRKYLLEDEHDLDELRTFASALEESIALHGSGWHDLSLRVKGWLAELESETWTST